MQTRKVILFLTIILLLSVAMAGCGAKDTPVPTPTRTPKPTFTPTPEGQVVNAPLFDQNVDATATGEPVAVLPTDTPTPPPPPTNTPAPTAPPDTPTPEPPSVTANQVVNVRSGPGTAYPVIGKAQPNQKFPVTGKNPQGDWWQINFNGQTGWIVDSLVTKEGQIDTVQVVASIPPAPTRPPAAPTATPIPQPTQPSTPTYPYSLGKGTWRCDPNPGTTYFNGFVRDRNNNPVNGVCVHIAFYGPRNTKCSGCDGVGNGAWGFSPFGGPAPKGTPVEIFVVPCPSGSLPAGGLTESTGFGDLTPQSDKWTMTINDSVQCTGITFYKN
jgi:uncharacterized protein YgiM (DUF1202 family)